MEATVLRKDPPRRESAVALPLELRPRERLLGAGPCGLGEVELLSLVLGTAGPRPAVRAAEELIATHGSLSELARSSPAELARAVGPARAARLSAALELGRRSLEPRARNLRLSTPEDVFQYARPRLGHLTKEVFHVLLLDTRHRLVADRRIAEGGLTSCAISPRDVFEAPIREAAPALIFLHNHPSGDPTPSRDDIELTRRLGSAARLLGISLLDHVVIADGGYASLAELGSL